MEMTTHNELALAAATKARAIVTAYKAANKELDTEAHQQIDGHMKEYQEHKAIAEKSLTEAKLMRELGDAEQWLSSSKGVFPNMNGEGIKAAGHVDESEVNALFQMWMKTNKDAVKDQYHRYAWKDTPQIKSVGTGFDETLFSSMNTKSYKALSSDVDISGGYTMMPMQLMQGIIKNVDNNLIMRKLATKITLDTAQATGYTTLTSDMSDANWVGEVTAVTADTTLEFGIRELYPKFMSKEIILSWVLLRSSYQNIENFIRDRLTYAFANTEDKAFLQGTGVNQPVGIFNATSNGAIGTGRDITAALTNTIGYNDLVNTIFTNLKEQYRNTPNTRVIANRAIIGNIMKLTDDNGDPIWLPGNIQTGQPAYLLGVPIMESENAPSALTTGSYVLAVGDISKYYIADSMDLQITRLNEQHALTMQVGFLGFKAVDGQPMLEEAFSRLKLA